MPTDTWLRIYGSKRRCAWVSLQQCLVWGCFADDGAGSHNSHIVGPMHGRTATDIVPLCRAHHDQLDGRQKIDGELYTAGVFIDTRVRFERTYDLNLREAADAVEALWQKLNPEETR